MEGSIWHMYPLPELQSFWNIMFCPLPDTSHDVWCPPGMLDMAGVTGKRIF